jgi:hypothetical protein
MMKRVLVSSVLCAALMLAGRGAEAADNWIGSWKMDAAKSKLSTGGIRAQTLRFEATGDGSIALTSDGTDADGKAMHGSYTAKFDGSDAVWAGNPLADTATPKRVDANTYENTWKKDGKPTVTAKVVVSKDGKTMTVTQTGTDAKGAKFTSVAVYDRQ